MSQRKRHRYDCPSSTLKLKSCGSSKEAVKTHSSHASGSGADEGTGVKPERTMTFMNTQEDEDDDDHVDD
ncbi:hypothetical protein Tco_0941604 [Tanacetum coccineum]|uniref:Uncharacterized protein n=1 Tax=Tanacetum coccineum TaxID=301880 RepID=A0ABQ5DY13_9ASTR